MSCFVSRLTFASYSRGVSPPLLCVLESSLRIIQTPHGDVRLNVLSPDDSGRAPVVLILGGSFPPREMFSDSRVEGAETALINLPCFWSPPFEVNSFDIFAEAFDHVIADAYGGRDVIVLGFSTGASVALGMVASEIRGMLVAEPFLATAQLWPLVSFYRRTLATMRPEAARFCDQVFGYRPDQIVDRQVQLRSPARKTVIVGDVPLLPPRDTVGYPSLTSEQDRSRLRAAGAELLTVKGGHAAPYIHRASLFQAAEEFCRSLERSDR